MINPDIMNDLLAIGMTKKNLMAVVDIINRLSVKQSQRLANQRARSRRWRAKDTSPQRYGDVTVTLPEKPHIEDNSSITTSYISEGKKDIIAAKPKRGARLNPDWQPSEADAAYALNAGIPLEAIPRVRDEFVDYWVPLPGSRGLSLNWSANWRNRIRQISHRFANKAANGKPKSRDKINATLDYYFPAEAGDPTSSRPALGPPIGSSISLNLQRGDGADDRGNGLDLHTVSRKHAEGDLQPFDGDAYTF